MKTTLSFHQLKLPRKRFEIATGVKESADVFIVEAKMEDKIGIGSGSPAMSVGDNSLRCRDALRKECERTLDPQDYFDDQVSFFVRDSSPSAAAAIDIAMWDLFAKLDGVPLCSILGLSGSKVEIDSTIDIQPPSDAAEEAKRLVEMGFKRIKVKVGVDVRKDVDRVTAIRESIGPEIALFVDANGGYDLAKAIEFWGKTEPLKIEFFEQPVPFDRLEDMAELRNEHGIRICADESVINEKDLARTIFNESLDIVNIKLMKCGGITPALEIIKIARNSDIDILMGCMGEAGISIAAAAHLSVGKGAVYADLDSHLNIEPICDGPIVSGGYLELSENPGLGVSLLEDWRRWLISQI